MPNEPVTLAQFGDVMTDADLCLLCNKDPRWPGNERTRARLAGRAPYLPPEIDGMGPRAHRYRKVDVQHWLETGRRVRVHIARVLAS
jgi:hypothetical protein